MTEATHIDRRKKTGTVADIIFVVFHAALTWLIAAFVVKLYRTGEGRGGPGTITLVIFMVLGAACWASLMFIWWRSIITRRDMSRRRKFSWGLGVLLYCFPLGTIYHLKYLWTSRFSLRTLAIFTLLCTSGAGLWLHWEPWGITEVVALERFSDFAYTSGIGEVFFSPDSTRVAHLTYYGKGGIWKVNTGALLAETKSLPPGIKFGAFSEDMESLLVRELVPTGTHWQSNYLRWRPPDEPLVSNSFQPELAARRLIRQLGKPIGPKRPETFPKWHEYNSTFSPDGKLAILLHSSGEILVYDESPLTPIHRGHVNGLGIVDCCVAPNGKDLLAATVYGQVLRIVRHHPEWWWGVFWLPEFWLTVAFAGLFVRSVWRDKRSLRVKGEPTE